MYDGITTFQWAGLRKLSVNEPYVPVHRPICSSMSSELIRHSPPFSYLKPRTHARPMQNIHEVLLGAHLFGFCQGRPIGPETSASEPLEPHTMIDDNVPVLILTHDMQCTGCGMLP